MVWSKETAPLRRNYGPGSHRKTGCIEKPGEIVKGPLFPAIVRASALSLLYDSVRSVRIQAALGVATQKNLALTKIQKKVLEKAIGEYISAMEYSSDFPVGRFNLGLIYTALGETQKAVENYEQAIRIDNLFFPAKNNLAMLFNAEGRNEQAEKLLWRHFPWNPIFYTTTPVPGYTRSVMTRPAP